MKNITKIIVLFSLFIIHISLSNAQTQSKEINFDSLLKANENYLDEDITKLKMLNQLAKGYHSINPSKGIETGEHAITLAQKLNKPLLLAEACNNKALNHFIKGEYPTSLELYGKAITINQSLNNTYGIATNTYNIGNIYNRKGESQKAKEKYDRALSLFESIQNKVGIAKAYNGLGVVYNSLSDYPTALEYFQKSLVIFEQLGNKIGMSANLVNIGNLYSSISDYPKALESQQKALVIVEQLGNKNSMAMILGNIGIAYYYLSEYSKALEYHQKALVINEQLGKKSSMARNLGNIGIVYKSLSDYPKSLEYYQKALEINTQLGNKSGMVYNLNNIGSLYRDVPDSVLVKIGIDPAQRYKKALEYQNQGLDLANEIGSLSQQKQAWINLSTIYEKQGDFAKAFSAYKKYIVLRDSTVSNEIKDQIERKTMQYEFDKKEREFEFLQQLSEEKLLRTKQEAKLSQQQLLLSNKEKDLARLAFLQTQAELHEQEILSDKQVALNQKKDAELKLLSKAKDLKETELQLSKADVQRKSQQRNGFILGSLLMLFLAGAILIGLRKTAKEKRKSEDLLLNILPAEVADELKNKGESIAKQYNHVSVLFTDFENFTGISAGLSPTELVEEIHKNFTAFDAIMEKHGIEKIKTIGDAYLAVCGLPIEVPDHAQRISRAAIEIQEYVKKSRGKFQMRVGINSGPVVAGIVGVKKFAYDIWGDAVNTASRMESYGVSGEVNISQSTYELIKDDSYFEIVPRGKIEAKGKGAVDMYFVNRKV